MKLRRVAPVAAVILLGLTGAAAAQMTVGGPPVGSFGAPPPGSLGGAPAGTLGTPMQGPGGMQSPMGGPQQMPPCIAEFTRIRESAEKRAAAIKAAAARRAGPQELCGLFGQFVDSESKMVRYIEEHQRACGIPPQALPAAKAGHAKTAETRDKVCQAAKFAGTGERRGPGLGDALGVRTAVPTVDASAHTGTFATLSGGGSLAGSTDAGNSTAK